MTKKSSRASQPAVVPLPPAIVIHGLAHAEAALAAAELGAPVTLISAEAAAGYAGPPWFCAFIEEVRAGQATLL